MVTLAMLVTIVVLRTDGWGGESGQGGEYRMLHGFNVLCIHDVGAGVAGAGDDEYPGTKGAERTLGLSRWGVDSGPVQVVNGKTGG